VVTASPETEACSDATLIEKSCREPEWFAALLDRHGDEIHRYAARRLGAQLADDVAAETFLTAFRKRSSYDVTRPDARPWLYGIATHAVRDFKRAEVRRNRMLARVESDVAAEPFDERSDSRVTAQQLAPQLAAVLAKLSAADRDLLLLVAWAELTYEETAQALGVPVGTVRSRLHRLRKKVRRALGGINPMATHEESLA
jgi:RNA polymerase sigma factor (sigma-70 family)